MENTDQANGRFVIDVENPVLRRPGAYLIRNRLNGKCYVGISQDLKRRLREHERGSGFSPVLLKAILKYGSGQFEAIPLFYSLAGTDHLPAIEADLIAAWGGVTHGYNVQASSGNVGPYGPAFGAILKAAFAKPETFQRKSDAMAVRMRRPGWAEEQAALIRKSHSLEARAKLSNSLLNFHANITPEAKAAWGAVKREIMSTPSYREKLSLSIGAAKMTPEARLKQSAQSKANMANPETRAKLSASSRITMATPEFKARRSAATIEVHSRPDVKARHRASVKAANADPEVKRKIAESKVGRVFATNGIKSRLLKAGESMPDGWRRGLSKRK
jgi:group I intron endonuclease